MPQHSEELKSLNAIAMSLAEMVLEHRERFGHDPVIAMEYVAGTRVTPDCTELTVIGASKKTMVHQLAR